MTDRVKSLIINSPTELPSFHWKRGDDGQLTKIKGRREASFESFNPKTGDIDDVSLNLANEIRGHVSDWRNNGYPGVTHLTELLLNHWTQENDQRSLPLYFCQIEAIETLIWCVEVAKGSEVEIPSDGGEWKRLCCKMATGSGKTLVMAMIILWQTVNAIAYPRRKEFSSNFLLVAPGLTVKKRLEVLKSSASDIYDSFDLCPYELRGYLNAATIIVLNKHKLHPLEAKRAAVDKRGPKSENIIVRDILGDIGNLKNFIVINDEAHHAYRATEQLANADDDSTKWIDGLDRIHRVRGIVTCFDMTATPFVSTSSSSAENTLFGWIVSDFGLYDAVEAGLVKTPYMVVKDSVLSKSDLSRSMLSRIYHDKNVIENLNRRATPEESLPDLVHTAYTILGADWQRAMQKWKRSGHYSPPVMLTVCNSMETAARIEHYFDSGLVQSTDLHAPDATLRVDSDVLARAEAGWIGGERKREKKYQERLDRIVELASITDIDRIRINKIGYAEILREIVDTVGKEGKIGQNIQNVISVMMLSEGWDANNVTHIMGLRSFSSQLLCEQVIGRGLRRVSYDKDENGFLLPEFVNVFGIPISLMLMVDPDDKAGPGNPSPSVEVRVLEDRKNHEISWPNVIRIESSLRPFIFVKWSEVEALDIDPAKTPISADLAPALEGATRADMVTDIDLRKFPEDFRVQKEIFKSTVRILKDLRECFVVEERRAADDLLVIQMIKIVEKFIKSKVNILSINEDDLLRKSILIALNSDRIVQHISRFVRGHNRTGSIMTLDKDRPTSSTSDMNTWTASESATVPTSKSHISRAKVDSTYETRSIEILETHPKVRSYAKNHRLGFWLWYSHEGRMRRYYPDFLVRLENGGMLVLEISGIKSDEKQAKKSALDEWVSAVNDDGRWGHWMCSEVYDPATIKTVIDYANR